MQLDTRKLENVVMADVQMFDFPDFVDAYVEYAEINGVELTAAQIVAAHGSKEIKIGDKTYNNNDSGLADSIKALNLLKC